MLAVVTGASGFLGTNLVAALQAQGIPVRALARPASASHGHALPGVERQVVELGDDPVAVARHPIWQGVTHVFHLSGVTRARDDAGFRAANTLPTSRLADALARRASPPRLVYVSSQAAAGPAVAASQPVTEDHVPAPVEPYGRSKLAAEEAVRARMPDLPAVILRPASVYGPHDRDFLAVFRQVRWPVAFLATPAGHQFSIAHVSDVTDALLRVARSDTALGATFFVAAREPVTWQGFYRAAARAQGFATRVMPLPSTLVRAAGAIGDRWGRLTDTTPLVSRQKVALAAPPFWLCDGSRLERAVGWRAATPLEAGLEETVAWYRQRGWL